MHAAAPLGVLAAMSKHQLAGTVALVVGIALVVLGAMRVIGRAATGALVPAIGVAVALVGVLLFTRVV